MVPPLFNEIRQKARFPGLSESLSLARGTVGAVKSPRPRRHFLIVCPRRARDGRFIERVGFFNPVARGQEEVSRIDLERVDYWLSKGAQPSDRVAGLIKAARNAAE